MEFHSFLTNLAFYEKDFKDFTELSQPDPFVEELITETYKDLSPLMKADLKLFYRDSALIPYTLISNWVIGQASSYREFRNQFKNMDADSMIHLLLTSESEDAQENETEEEAFIRLEEQMETLESDYRILESYRELKKFPDETMNRFRHFLDQFYYTYFEKAENKIESFLQEKVKEHREIYLNDEDFFKKSIVKVSFDDICTSDVTYQFTVGYLNGASQSYHPTDCQVFCYYGYLNEKFLDPGYYDRQIIEFFKMLADETRLKMLRMMVKKSWYTSEMAEELGINKATVSYHMKMFTRFNIVDISLGKNKRIYYKADRENIENMMQGFIGSLSLD
jgi:DNA-binding transcriptional ArsR family regulator